MMGLGPHSKVEFYWTMEVYFTLQWDWAPPFQCGVSFLHGFLLSFTMGLGPHFEMNCCLNNTTILLHYTMGLGPHFEVDSTSQWDWAPIAKWLVFW